MLTEPVIRKKLKEGKDVQLADGNGRGAGRLVLRIRNGKADWYAQQWVNNRRVLTIIGQYPTITLAGARIEFETNFRSKIVKRESIKEAIPTASVKCLFDDYVAHLKSNGKRSWEDVEYVLDRMAILIGQTKLANQVTSRDVVESIRPTYEAGHPSMADHMRGYIRAAYGWAIRSQNDYRSKAHDKFKIRTNPAADIPTEPKKAGTRWLSVPELRSLYHWGGTSHINRNTDPRNYVAIRLLILTGQRSEEIARLNSSMLNRDELLIEWPTTKPGRAHVLPITQRILELIDQAKPNEHGLFFPSEVFPDRPVTDQTLRKVCTSFCAATKTERFSPRDLRRTWKTLSGHAGLLKEDRDRLQNHALSDVSSVHYDRYDYIREKRAAMEKWDSWIFSRLSA